MQVKHKKILENPVLLPIIIGIIKYNSIYSMYDGVENSARH